MPPPPLLLYHLLLLLLHMLLLLYYLLLLLHPPTHLRVHHPVAPVASHIGWQLTSARLLQTLNDRLQPHRQHAKASAL
jgi:hypothetical protein